ncbi:MAG TPA: HAD-IIIA family hydrolase [Nitriliruptorales bacterium]|nr:HAD-IIIA family hydrolase [Nitriliruptorales bacterium]
MSADGPRCDAVVPTVGRPRYDVVVPTVGRPSLSRLLAALAAAEGPPPRRVVVVDDRRDRSAPLLAGGVPDGLRHLVRILPGPAAGPAAARNLGWRACSSPWVAFLDDDVVPRPDWAVRLAADLEGLPGDVAGSQGRIEVPLPRDRAATDWERNVAGLRGARWATANLAYRHDVLAALGGFDERFPRAYREDADVGLRVAASGYRIVRGARTVDHPVSPAGPWVSLVKQAGNADDALMAALHGPGWRARAGVPRGRRPLHLLTSVAGVAAVAARAVGRRGVAAVALGAWLGASAEFAWRRIAPGPRTAREVTTMVATSALLPAVATYHWLRGAVRARHVAASPRPAQAPAGGRVAAVLLDRDGTLVEDVPYNGDPAAVRPLPGTRAALDRLRAGGLCLAVVSNQSGLARGLLAPAEVAAVNARVEQLLGPFDGWFVCSHGPDDGCGCRKPAPGLLLAAAAELGVEPADCAMVGDIGADTEAAAAAGARPVLVPTPATRPEEVAAAMEVAADLEVVADRLLGVAATGVDR